MPPLSAQDRDFNLLLSVGLKSKSVNAQRFWKTPNGRNNQSFGPHKKKSKLLVTKIKLFAQYFVALTSSIHEGFNYQI